MALFDLLGRRDCLAVLWALRDGPVTFRGLQTAAGGVAAATLSSRTKELRKAKLIELTDDGYVLTEIGRDLLEVGLPLENWAITWAQSLDDE
ncbi:helix-turn-helix domain-containing protein [Gordonia sp. 'Campus']|uniref:winged helix-turn-helix transcriptional regulator n=1 Tax=Gordonia sp. 'Campus' TaxID=2915824 RepID=UPI001EE46C93|nr:winged helix-turn-helix transcriptional regulator [Gordonia sp. 'Campus']